jgi:hypothetical protein
MAEPSPSQLLSDLEAAAKAKDADKLATYYASDAVFCGTPEEIVTGQTAIKNDFAKQFQDGWVLTGITPNQPSINQINQNWAWAVGQWTGSFPALGPLSGCWSILLVNQPTTGQPHNWLIQQHTIVTDLPKQSG